MTAQQNYIYSSRDFGKTKSYIEVELPERLIHKGVTKGQLDDDFSADRKHPVHVVDLPSRAVSMSIGGLEKRTKHPQPSS
jgi:gentisate 1,2-dioxygenase